MYLQLGAVREELQAAQATSNAAVASAADASIARKQAEANATQAAENLRAAEAEVDLVGQQNEQMFRYVRLGFSSLSWSLPPAYVTTLLSGRKGYTQPRHLNLPKRSQILYDAELILAEAFLHVQPRI